MYEDSPWKSRWAVIICAPCSRILCSTRSPAQSCCAHYRPTLQSDFTSLQSNRSRKRKSVIFYWQKIAWVTKQLIIHNTHSGSDTRPTHSLRSTRAKVDLQHLKTPLRAPSKILLLYFAHMLEAVMFSPNEWQHVELQLLSVLLPPAIQLSIELKKELPLIYTPIIFHDWFIVTVSAWDFKRKWEQAGKNVTCFSEGETLGRRREGPSRSVSSSRWCITAEGLPPLWSLAVGIWLLL